MTRLRATALALCCVVAGCVSSRGLRTRGTPLDPHSLEAERSFAEVALSPTAWPAQDWWLRFGDPQLTALIGEALQNNPSLDESAARARQAQALADSLDGARRPQIDFNSSVTGAFLSKRDPVYPEYALGKFGWAKSVTLSFSWDLDLWGGRRAAWEGALGRSRSAQIDAYATRIQVSVNVARAYVGLGYAFAQRDVTEAEVQRATQSLSLTRRLVAGGLGTPQQENLADSQLASAEQQQAQADRAIDAARSALSVLVGQGPDRGLDISRPHLLDPAMVAVPDNLAVDLVGRRADLVAARWQVEAAAQDIKAARSEFLPNVSLSALGGFMLLGSGNPLTLPARTYSVGPALSLPVFDGGRLRAQLASDDAGYDEMVARYNGLLIAALNDVSDQVSALASVRKQIALEKRAQQDALKSWNDALTAYKGGLSGPLTPLIARQQLLLTEQTEVLLESEQADTSIRLIEALGGGYSDTR